LPDTLVDAHRERIVTREIVIQAIISGLLMGFVYALIAAGLSLIFGLMEIVNFAHGEFLMLSMFSAFWFWALFGVDPLYSLPVTAALLALLGLVVHYGIIRHILRASMLAVEVLGIFLGLPQIVASVGCLMGFTLLYVFITRTETGLALQATAQDRQAASLMGIPTDRMFALGWAIGAACVGVAGGLLSTFYFVFPEVGFQFALLAYVAVALGGFGSILGCLLAGVLIGLVEALGGLLIDPSFKYLMIFGLYLAVVFFRPQGLFGRF
jgi:branched-chain amino acid transport system permease protein